MVYASSIGVMIGIAPDHASVKVVRQTVQQIHRIAYTFGVLVGDFWILSFEEALFSSTPTELPDILGDGVGEFRNRGGASARRTVYHSARLAG